MKRGLLFIVLALLCISSISITAKAEIASGEIKCWRDPGDHLGFYDDITPAGQLFWSIDDDYNLKITGSGIPEPTVRLVHGSYNYFDGYKQELYFGREYKQYIPYIKSIDTSNAQISLNNDTYGLIFEDYDSLESLDLSGVITEGEIHLINNDVLSTVVFPDKMDQLEYLYIENNPQLTNLDFSSLATVPDIMIHLKNVINTSLNLTPLGGRDNVIFAVEDCQYLNEINLEPLSTVKDLYLYFDSLALTNIDLTKLKNNENVYLEIHDASIPSINLSTLDNKLRSIDIINNKSLSTINLSPLSHQIDLMEYGYSEIESINLGIQNGGYDLYSMFKCCTKLKSIDISKFIVPEIAYDIDLNKFNDDDLWNLKLHDTALLEGYDSYIMKDYYSVTDKYFKKSTSSTISMFEGCTNLQSVDMSTIDMQYNNSSANMFKDCINLNTINFPENTYIGVSSQEMFKNCKSLPGVTTTKFISGNTSDSIDGTCKEMFYGCDIIDTINFNKSDLSHISNMQYMFAECPNLTSINLIETPVINAITMNHMFLNDISLPNIDINFNTSKLITTEYMFSGCNSLEEVNIINWNTNSIKKTISMFADCWSLKNIDLSSWVVTTLENTTNMFYNCKALTDCNISNWDGIAWLQANGMFLNCESITNINMEGINTPELWEVNNMFRNCNSLESLDLSDWETENIINLNAAFQDCLSLKDLNLDNWNTTNLVTLSNTFNNCKAIETIDVSGIKTDNVTDIDGTFSGCTNLKEIDISHWVAYNVWSMAEMFKGCESLEVIDLSKLNADYVSEIDYLFANCINLKHLDLTTCNFSNQADAEGVFLNTKALETIQTPITTFALPELKTYIWVNEEGVLVTRTTESELIFRKKDKYNITYKLDGGYSEDLIRTYNYQGLSLDTIPVKPGYSFEGWYLDNEYTQPITEIEEYTYEDLTLYAKWSPIVYNINYELNGGVNNPDNPTSYTIETSDIVFKEPTKEGYVFLGWYFDEAFTQQSVQISSDTISDITVYAKWTDEIYNINYELNGGKNHSDNPHVYSNDLASITLKNPTKDGYTFVGWYLDDKFENKIESIGNLSSDITLYAKWLENVYKITYELNGGINHEDNPTSYSTEDEDIVLEYPTKEGYQFLGWYFDPDFKNQAVVLYADDIADITLYAKWKIKTYTISYKCNGGTNSINNTNYYTIEDTIIFENPTRTSCTFKGWYLDEEFTKPITQIQKGTTGNYILYAKWDAVDYNINYELNGGTNHKDNPISYNATTTKFTIESPSKDGYNFKGWYLDNEFTKPISQLENVLQDITLYAKWEIIEYPIQYQLNGGVNSENPTKYTVETSAIRLLEPTKTGHIFNGWYLDKDFTKPITTIAKGTTGRILVYAKWTAKTYTITYELNGGINHKDNPTSFSYSKVNLNFEMPTKEGYQFLGWYLDENFTQPLSTFDGKFRDLVLYAKWKKLDKPQTSTENNNSSTESSTEQSTTETNKNEQTTTQDSTKEEVKEEYTNTTKTSIKKLKNVRSKKLKVTVAKKIGYKYQIQIATNKKFTKNKKQYNTSKSTYTIKKLQKGKTYYVRVRTYKVIDNHKYFSKWSTVKKIKIKK